MEKRETNRCLRMIALGLWVMLGMGSKAAAPATAEERIAKLQRSLLAPCCWAETIDQHESEVARQMRAEIAMFVREGRTDQEILAYYKQRYGARVLVEPEGAIWWWMHVVPVAALALGIAIVVSLLRRWRKPLPA